MKKKFALARPTRAIVAAAANPSQHGTLKRRSASNSSNSSSSSRAARRPSSGTSRNVRFAFSMLLIGGGICLGTLYSTWERAMSRSRRATTFESDSVHIQEAFSRTFDQFAVAAAATHNHMASSWNETTTTDQLFSPAKFESFARVFSNLGLRYKAISHIPRVVHSQRAAMEASAGAYWTKYFADQGVKYNYTGFHGLEPNPGQPGQVLSSRSPQDEYHLVRYIYPVRGNDAALDFDLYSVPARRVAIDTARSSGKPSLTARLQLVQETDASVYSVILFSPGSSDGQDHLISVVVRIPDLFKQTMVKLSTNVELYLYDQISPAGAGAEFLGGYIVEQVEHKPGAVVGNRRSHEISERTLPEVKLSTLIESATRDVLVLNQTFSIADRTWVFVTRATPRYEPDDSTSELVGAVVFCMLGMLLAGWYQMDARMHDRVTRQYAAHEVREATTTAAAETERRVNEFVAHEVRNPLSVALTANSFTLKAIEAAPWGDDEDQTKCVALRDAGLVQTSLAFIHELLDNMADVNRFSRRTVQVHQSRLSLRDDVLLRVKQMLDHNSVIQPDAPQRCVQVTVADAADDPLWAIADGIRLVQVVMSLVKNAMRRDPGGQVIVSAHRKSGFDEGVLIKVCDTGAAVPAHGRASLFARSALDLSRQHSNMGLHLCHTIVTSMNGRVYLDDKYVSSKPGFPGACFVVDLPVPLVESPPAATASTTTATANQATQPAAANRLGSSRQTDSTSATHCANNSTKLTIASHVSSEFAAHDELTVARRCLIIDDDAVVRTMFKRLLKRCFASWHVETAESGEAALELVKPKSVGGKGLAFDVSFVDQYMPGPNNPMTGDQVISAMRKDGVPGYRIGCSANEVRDLHVAAGADDFVRKPIGLQGVRDIVKRVFAQPPLRVCLIIGKNNSARAEVKHRLKSVTRPDCVFHEAESVDSAVQAMMMNPATTSPTDTVGLGSGRNRIELIAVDASCCVPCVALAGEVADRLRRHVSSTAKLVIISATRHSSSSNRSDGGDGGGGQDEDVRASSSAAVPPGFHLAWPRPLPLTLSIHADLMRVLLPSSSDTTTTTIITDSATKEPLLASSAANSSPSGCANRRQEIKVVVE